MRSLKEAKHRKLSEVGADMYSEEDAFGSYTGVVIDDCHDKPIQDADDL